MQSLDITSEGLKAQGYTLKREGVTIALYHNDDGSCKRFSFYKNDWNKTVKKAEEKLAEQGVSWEVIQATLVCLSASYPKLMNGSDSSSNATAIAASSMIETPTEKLDITPEQWVQDLMTRYKILQGVIENSVPPLSQLKLPLEYALSVKNILNIADCTLPFVGILLGVPSSLKTVVIELFRPYWHAKYSDDFSPKSFVSHYSGLPEEDLQKIDLLPKIKYKLFLTPELAPLFTGNEDDIKKAFGNLTRILDGKGFQSDSGTQGSRGYYGDFMFAWIGAVVDISSRVHRMMGNLGPKMYFLRLSKSYQKEENLQEQLRDPQFVSDVAKIQKALFDYLKWFEACPLMAVGKEGIPRIVWDNTPGKNEDKALRYIARLAMLIGPLRGVVEVMDTAHTQGVDYGFTIPIVEEPWRANQQLYNLARGHALIFGRNYITVEDIPLPIKVVMSTAPIARVAVFEMLLANGGSLKTSDIKSGLGISHHTVHKTMVELELLGLVESDKDGEFDNSERTITLKRQFKWCLGTRFKQLREGFSPARKARKQALSEKRSSDRGDNVDGGSRKLEEMSGRGNKRINDVFVGLSPEQEEVFWKVLDTIEIKHTSSLDGDSSPANTISESGFKQALISSNMFTSGEAHKVIRDAKDHHILTRIEHDVLVKNSQANTSKSEEK